MGLLNLSRKLFKNADIENRFYGNDFFDAFSATPK